MINKINPYLYFNINISLSYFPKVINHVINVVQFRYTQMRNCWDVNPDERPCFEEIHDALTHMFTEDELNV